MPRVCLEIVAGDAEAYLGFIRLLRKKVIENGGLVMPPGDGVGWLLAATRNVLITIYLGGAATPVAPQGLIETSGVKARAVIEGDPLEVVEAANTIYGACRATGIRVYPVSEKQC